MTSWSEPARELPARPRHVRPRPRPATTRRRKTRQSGAVAGGIVWIALVGLLLAGVVALNVAVLRLTVRLDNLNEQRAKLRAENAALASHLSSAAASPRIQELARQQGLVPAQPDDTAYVELDPRGR